MPKPIRIIDPYADLSSYKKIVAKYGGEFSFFQNIKMGGVGSPRMTYLSGIPAFDEISALDTPERAYLNLALVKKGIIFRINKRQVLGSAIAHLSSFNHIKLTAFEIYNHEMNEIKIAGDLEISIADQNIYLAISAQNIKKVDEFFNKSFFKSLYQFTMDNSEPRRSNDPNFPTAEYYLT